MLEGVLEARDDTTLDIRSGGGTASVSRNDGFVAKAVGRLYALRLLSALS